MENLKYYRLWQTYMQNIPAPQDFIDISFFWMINAALQRRVYLQCEEKPLFCNLYVILVADPSIGKGLAIDPVVEILRNLKLREQKLLGEDSLQAPDGADPNVLASIAQLEKVIEKLEGGVKKSKPPPLLFPVAPDDLSYQKLVEIMSTSTRRINVEPTPILAPSGSYSHCSMCVALSEMATLFKKNAEQTLKFLLKTYDCGDYEYSTISRDRDLVRRCCLSLLAGTTPNTMSEMFDKSIVDDGWSSRCIFVFAENRRFNFFRIKDFTEEQINCGQEVIQHLKNLSRVFGRISYHPDTVDYLDKYFENGLGYRNPHPYLQPYYGRKNLHVAKLAVAFHFAGQDITFNNGRPNYNKELKLETAQQTIAFLERLERNMHLALNVKAKNPASDLASKIMKELVMGRMVTKKELLIKYWNEMPQGIITLDEALNHLLNVGKITTDDSNKELKYKRV